MIACACGICVARRSPPTQSIVSLCVSPPRRAATRPRLRDRHRAPPRSGRPRRERRGSLRE
eukprot:3398684-Prymnesium_polylepis.1